MSSIRVQGMHGLGDNIHQRALMRLLMKKHTVYLETPWPWVYHDLAGSRLRLLPVDSKLRTQAKNVVRERGNYYRGGVPAMRPQRVWYPPQSVRQKGSVLGAMLANAGFDDRDANFQMPLKAEWYDQAAELIRGWLPAKPILIFRPLIERTEWSGCPARNPDHAAYRALLEAIREDFFVVSVADLEADREWLADGELPADVRLHAGELEPQVLAALMTKAGLVMTSPGFAAVMAQAVGTPVVTVFGGYEDATSFAAGAHLAAYLPIEPEKPCRCFSHHHDCDKRIDLASAIDRLRAFCNEVVHAQPAHRQPRSA